MNAHACIYLCGSYIIRKSTDVLATIILKSLQRNCAHRTRKHLFYNVQLVEETCVEVFLVFRGSTP